MITFAAIDIGSYVIEMKVFEMSSRVGIREIDCIRYRLELGKDAYRMGKIGTEKVEKLCEILNSFMETMKGYKVNEYRVCATSAIRELGNRNILLDYIEKRTGLQLEVLGNAEQRFLDYKSIASRENEFNRIIQKGTAIVDMGGGSIQLSLFDKDSLIATQNIRVGNLRLREKVAEFESMIAHKELVFKELINDELLSFQKLYVKEREIKNIIVVGDDIREFAGKSSMTREEFFQLYEELKNGDSMELSETHGMTEESVHLLYPSFVIYKSFMENVGGDTVWMPGLQLCDGIAYDYAVRNKIIKSTHSFDDDIIASARNVAKRYQCNKNHYRLLENIGLKIFDKTRRLHGLGNRERLLLQIAVILHGCGKYVSLSHPAQSGYHIIMETEIIGLSAAEREIIANVVRFNTQDFVYYNQISEYSSITRDAYLLIAKLTAILRIANALDRSHKQKIQDPVISIKNNKLVIVVHTDEDLTIEKGFFPHKAEFFKEVFHLEPELHQKKKR